jgi:acyl-CoA thioester hydrolase
MADANALKDGPCPPRDRLAAYPLRLAAATRIADLDHNGHVNGVRICEFYEDARADFHRTMTVRGVRAFVAQFNVRYLAEVRWPGALQVTTGVTRVGNSSFEIGQALFQDDRCVGQADTVLVHVLDGRPQRLPQPYRAALEDYRVRSA